MPARLKFNAVLCLLLAVLFYRFFMFTKHDPIVSPLVPFGDDPYDAIGSFCMLLSFVLALRSAWRAFRPYRSTAPTPLGLLFLARTQLAIPIGILITFAADLIALLRHPAQWVQKPAAPELLVLMAGMALLSFGLVLLFRKSPTAADSPAHSERRKAVIAAIIAFPALALFPESLIPSPGFHLLAILFGFALIAATQAIFTVALLPTPLSAPAASDANPKPTRTWLPWAWIAAFGVLLGASVFATELGEGGGISANRVVLVAALFVGSGTGLAVISFAFFKKPLGLFQKSTA